MSGEAADTTFTAGETKLIVSIIKNLNGDIQSNWDAVAQEMGYKDGTIGRTRWSQIRRKKINNNGVPNSPTTTSSSTPNKPTGVTKNKTPKSVGGGRKTKAKKKMDSDEDEDDEVVKTPVGKGKGGKGKGKGKEKVEESDEDGMGVEAKVKEEKIDGGEEEGDAVEGGVALEEEVLVKGEEDDGAEPEA